MEYLVTDCWTNRTTWISAESARDALIVHENEKRTNVPQHQRSSKLLTASALAHHHSRGDIIDVQIADSRIVGLRASVMR